MQEGHAVHAVPVATGGSTERQDYVPLILRAMAAQSTSLRELALRAGIGKSRLGLLMHRDAAKRSPMTLREFQRILAALEIDPIEAVISVELAWEVDGECAARHRRLVAMLCAMFRGLPSKLIAELEELDGVEGTEVRLEWGPVLQRAVIKRLVHEVGAVIRRRADLSDFGLFS